MCCHIWSDLFGGLKRRHLVDAVAFRAVRARGGMTCVK